MERVDNTDPAGQVTYFEGSDGRDVVKAIEVFRGSWQWLKNQLAGDVPDDIALCEFDCPREQCTEGEWATCERRRHKGAGDLFPQAMSVTSQPTDGPQPESSPHLPPLEHKGRTPTVPPAATAFPMPLPSGPPQSTPNANARGAEVAAVIEKAQ